MNIFPLEKNKDGTIDWIGSAKSQDNYRVVKMILESCQMLCTSLNMLYAESKGYEQVAPYRSAYKQHPSTKWARESSRNFEMLVEHTEALIQEYKERFNGKFHKCELVLDKVKALYRADIFPKHEPTPLPLCMPEEFKGEDIVESYRKFYASKPRMKYPKNKIPVWFEGYRGETPFIVI